MVPKKTTPAPVVQTKGGVEIVRDRSEAIGWLEKIGRPALTIVCLLIVMLMLMGPLVPEVMQSINPLVLMMLAVPAFFCALSLNWSDPATERYIKRLESALREYNQSDRG